MITRKEFEEMILRAKEAFSRPNEIAPWYFHYGQILGVIKALTFKDKLDAYGDIEGQVCDEAQSLELLDRLFPPIPEPSGETPHISGVPYTGRNSGSVGRYEPQAPMEREAPYKIEVGGFGEQDVLLARDFLIREIGGFKMLPPGVIGRLQNLLEREAERQKFLAWLGAECDEITKIPNSIEQLSEYLEKWLCRE